MVGGPGPVEALQLLDEVLARLVEGGAAALATAGHGQAQPGPDVGEDGVRVPARVGAVGRTPAGGGLEQPGHQL